MLAWIVLVHLAALGLVLFCSLNVSRLVGLSSFISAGFCLSYLRWYRSRWLGVSYRKGAWKLAGKRGEETAELLGYHFLFGLLLMHFSVGGRSRRMLLLPDSVDHDSLRRLRQLLMLAQA